MGLLAWPAPPIIDLPALLPLLDSLTGKALVAFSDACAVSHTSFHAATWSRSMRPAVTPASTVASSSSGRSSGAGTGKGHPKR